MHKFRAAVRHAGFTPSVPPHPMGWRSKLLISLGFDFCFFSGQFKKGLDLQGFRARKKHLSTKLSTESLDSCGSHVKSMTYITFRQFD
jgi:hypothetical protein